MHRNHTILMCNKSIFTTSNHLEPAFAHSLPLFITLHQLLLYSTNFCHLLPSFSNFYYLSLIFINFSSFKNGSTSFFISDMHQSHQHVGCHATGINYLLIILYMLCIVCIYSPKPYVKHKS